MYTFFHGWRRKAGVIALVMALVMMGVWIRSLTIRDVIQLPVLGRLSYVISAGSKIHLHPTRIHAYGKRVEWTCSEFYPDPEGLTAFRDSLSGYAVPVWDWTGFVLSSEIWRIPYYSIVSPLAIFSFYLIIWKPRSGRDMTKTDGRQSSVE
ncbi:MAG TPA: hypothetical protein VGM98_18935 [Schlesneria sp.]